MPLVGSVEIQTLDLMGALILGLISISFFSIIWGLLPSASHGKRMQDGRSDCDHHFVLTQLKIEKELKPA